MGKTKTVFVTELSFVTLKRRAKTIHEYFGNFVIFFFNKR